VLRVLDSFGIGVTFGRCEPSFKDGLELLFGVVLPVETSEFSLLLEGSSVLLGAFDPIDEFLDGEFELSSLLPRALLA
jgi:hypothetical protein